MILEWETFNQSARHMIEVSERLQDGWKLNIVKDEPNCVYLVKKLIVTDKISTIKEEDFYEENNILSESYDDVPNLNQSLVSYEYHVVYSSSYSVPVLYFNAYKQDGSLLKLEEIWERVPKIYSTQLENQKWSMLTQQEHPILGRPFYCLHPCNTKDLMRQILGSKSESESNINYLITWLSSVGPVVGLTMNPKYAVTFNNDLKTCAQI